MSHYGINFSINFEPAKAPISVLYQNCLCLLCGQEVFIFKTTSNYLEKVSSHFFHIECVLQCYILQYEKKLQAGRTRLRQEMRNDISVIFHKQAWWSWCGQHLMEFCMYYKYFYDFSYLDIFFNLILFRVDSQEKDTPASTSVSKDMLRRKGAWKSELFKDILDPF